MTVIGCYLGIDPGKEGGLAIISHDGVLKAWPMPLMPNADGKLVVDEMKAGKLFLTRIKPAGVAECRIEQVHSMPWDGVASAFKFGRNAGLLIGLLIAHEIIFEEIPPETWQKALGIQARQKPPKFKGKALINFPPEETKAQWKRRLMESALQLFPGHEEITLETADAVLIAEVTRRMCTGYRGRPIV